MKAEQAGRWEQEMQIVILANHWKLEENVHNVRACPNTSKRKYKLGHHILAIGQSSHPICTGCLTTFS